jgi:hypothetical protein
LTKKKMGYAARMHHNNTTSHSEVKFGIPIPQETISQAGRIAKRNVGAMLPVLRQHLGQMNFDKEQKKNSMANSN